MPQAVLPFIPSIIGAGSSLLGGILGSSASDKAAKQLQAAQGKVISGTNDAVAQGKSDIATGTTNANDILSRSAQSQLALYAPYINAGQEGLASIQQLAGAGGPLDQQFSFNPTDLEKDPGYAFALKQGQDAINRAQSAKGNLFSGSTMKSLAGYTTGTANQYFNDAYSRAANTFNINKSTALSRIGTMQGLASMGLSGTSGGAGAISSTSGAQAGNAFGQGTQFANLGMEGNRTIASALTNQGQAQAAGTVGSSNAWTGAATGIGNAASQAGIMQFLLNRGVFGNPKGGGSGSGGGGGYGGGGGNNETP